MRISDWSSDVCSSDLSPADLVFVWRCRTHRYRSDSYKPLTSRRCSAIRFESRLSASCKESDDVHPRLRRPAHLSDQRSSTTDGPASRRQKAPADISRERSRDDGLAKHEHQRSEEHTSELKSLM